MIASGAAASPTWVVEHIAAVHNVVSIVVDVVVVVEDIGEETHSREGKVRRRPEG